MMRSTQRGSRCMRNKVKNPSAFLQTYLSSSFLTPQLLLLEGSSFCVDHRVLALAIPWNRKWQPAQYSCLENLMDRGGWRTAVQRVTKSQTQLSTQAHASYSLHLEHFLSVLCRYWSYWSSERCHFSQASEVAAQWLSHPLILIWGRTLTLIFFFFFFFCLWSC